jgi:hypothetical protein
MSEKAGFLAMLNKKLYDIQQAIFTITNGQYAHAGGYQDFH